MVPDPPTTHDEHDEHDEDVFYPVTEKVGKTGLQSVVTRDLFTLLDDYFISHGRSVLVGMNQFFYYKKGDPGTRVDPDLYLVDDEATPLYEVENWKVWERGGKVPALAFEIVSSDFPKDYDHTFLERYQQLGVRELIRYEPKDDRGDHHLAHWVRDSAGILVPQTTLHDRVRSAYFGFWFVIGLRRSLALVIESDEVTPWRTRAERDLEAAVARRKAEAARADAAEAARKAEAARAAAAEAARKAAAARVAAAEAEIQRLSAELARLRAE